MKKATQLLFFALLATLFLTGCSARLMTEEAERFDSPVWEVAPATENLNITSYAILSLKNISRIGCTVDMQNSGERIIHIGTPFHYNLQLWDGSQWNSIFFVDFNHSTSGEATPLTRFRGTVEWGKLYGELPDGIYRMIVAYSAKAHDAEWDEDWEHCHAVCEFEIS